MPQPHYTIRGSKTAKRPTAAKVLHEEAADAHLVQLDMRADFHARVQAGLHCGQFDPGALRPWFWEAVARSTGRSLTT